MLNGIRRRLHLRLDGRGLPTSPPSESGTALRAALDALALELRDLNATTTNGYRASADATRAEIDVVNERLVALEAAVAHLAAKQTAFDEYVREWVPESVDALRVHVEAHIGEAVERAIDGFHTRLRRVERSAQTTASAAATAPMSVAADSVVRERPPAATDGSGFGLNYSAFEDQLRGTPEHVKALEAIHIETIAGFGAEGLPVLDVGCGRGELLVLLGEAGIPARGVDLNPVSIAECVDAGLDAVTGDAVAYLRSLEPGSLRAVCGLHIVEHMTDADRMALFSAAHHAIAAGGGIIMETPNPENLRVGSTTFWLDPTHLRPVPPQLLEFQIDQAGFDDVTVQRLHPGDDAVAIPADADPVLAELGEFVNRLCAGPMDYAVIGRKS